MAEHRVTSFLKGNFLFLYRVCNRNLCDFTSQITPRSAAAYFVRVLRENGSDSDRAKAAQSKLSACSALLDEAAPRQN